MARVGIRMVLIASATSLGLTGCASIPGLGSSRQARSPALSESFAYAPAGDGNIRVVVDRVAMRGDSEFIPRDPNWLQLHVTVSNVGSRPIAIGSFQERLAGGAVLGAATSGVELARAPRIDAATARSLGIGAAGGIVSALLFPPAAIVGALLSGRSLTRGANRQMSAMERFNATALRPGSIAPGTSTSGFVFLPAVIGQTGVIVLYSLGGIESSLLIPRVESLPPTPRA